MFCQLEEDDKVSVWNVPGSILPQPNQDDEGSPPSSLEDAGLLGGTGRPVVLLGPAGPGSLLVVDKLNHGLSPTTTGEL